MEDQFASVEARVVGLGNGRIAACCVIASDDAWIVFVEIERRSGRDRRAREVDPSDALERFWRTERAGVERRRNARLATELRDDVLEQAIRDELRAVSTYSPIVVVRFVLPKTLPRDGHGAIDRQRLRKLHEGGYV